MIPSEKDYWRALILYGRNASTYKIALGKLLSNYAFENRTRINMDEVASDFIDLYCNRLKNGKPQIGLSGRKTVVEREIDAITTGQKDKSDSIPIVKRSALLDMVLQRFNTLNRNVIRRPFYTISEDENHLIINNNTLTIFSEREQTASLADELMSRWDLLEHAYEKTKQIESLDVDQYLEHVVKQEKRVNLTPLVPTLNGYQQGRCFYCGEELYDIQVDHVIPYQAVMHNQLWNLVLAHEFCNQNKSDNLPPKHFVENLIKRNEYFISSSHPIKDTLVRQIGDTPKKRRDKINNEFLYAKGKIGRIWEGDSKYDPRKDRFYRDWVKFLGN